MPRSRLCACGAVGLYFFNGVTACKAHKSRAVAAAVGDVRVREIGHPDKERYRHERDGAALDHAAAVCVRRNRR